MPQIVISTTFRDFDGSPNDGMQIQFLHSLRRQTFQDFVLVVTVFNEKKVDVVVRKILGNHATIIYDFGSEKYKFSLSKTFMNGVDYGLANHSKILIDCSSDIVLQNNFLEVVNKRIKNYAAGISHPNVFREKMDNGRVHYSYGKIGRGIDIRFYSLDLFQKKHVYDLLNRFPSYDYGAGIERILCGIAIKYAKRRFNIFMESKVLKEENSRDGQIGIESEFMRKGAERNIPVTERFIRSEQIPQKYICLLEMNRAYRVTKNAWMYRLWFGREIADYYFKRLADRICDKK